MVRLRQDQGPANPLPVPPLTSRSTGDAALTAVLAYFNGALC